MIVIHSIQMVMIRLFCSSINRRADENIRKSVFREIEKYDSNTKLGLQVFHLQQLSLTSLKDFDMINNPLYMKLKQNLLARDSVSKLSPAQMVATCISLGKLGSSNRREWTVLADAVKAHAKKSKPTSPSESTIGQALSPSQVGLCLYAFTRTGNAWLFKQPTVELVVKHVLRKSVEWTPIDMGWYLYFMRERKTQSVDLIDQIAYRFNERLSHMTSRNISCILHEFSRLKILPGHAINRACFYLQKKMNKIDPKTVTLLFAALARLRVYKIAFIHSLANHVSQNFTLYTPSQLCTIMHALAKLSVFNPPLVGLVIAKFQNSFLGECDFALFAFSLGQFRIRHVIWEKLIIQFNRDLQSFNAQTVSIFLTALARVDDTAKPGFAVDSYKRVPYSFESLVHPVWLAHVLKHVRSTRSGYTDRQVLNSLHALAKLGAVSIGPLPKWKIKLPITPTVENQINFINKNIVS